MDTPLSTFRPVKLLKVAVVVLDAVPVPAALIAETLNRYEVPPSRPVTVAEAVVEEPSENVAHVVPLSDEYSTV